MTGRRMPQAVLAIGAIALLVLVLSGGSPYVVRAEFADASGLRPDFTVRLDGVNVGRVASVSVTSDTTAMVTLDLDRSAAPVGQNASVSIQPSNLLGEKFVALQPGNVADPAPSGTLIPLARTSTPTELDQVISTFNPSARQALAIFLSEEGDALLGRGSDLTTTLMRMPGALGSVTTLVSQLGSDTRALGALVDQSDQILTDVASHRVQLGRLVAGASGAFATLASREQGLGATIVAAPGALAQLRTSLIALRQAAGPVAAAAAGLRTTAAPLTATLRAVPGFSRSALPTLRTVQAVAPTLTRLGAQATPVVTRLGGLGTQLDTFARDANPVTATLNAGISNLLGFMEGWDRSIQDRDAAGHLFRPYAVTPVNAIAEGLLGTFIKTGSLTGARARTPAAAIHNVPQPSSRAASGATPAPPPAVASATGAPADKPVLGLGTAHPILPITLPPVTLPSVPKLAGTVSSLLKYLLGK